MSSRRDSRVAKESEYRWRVGRAGHANLVYADLFA